MAPKNKYTRERIIQAGLEITRESGSEAVTARAVASRLGCSVAPIFTAFSDMDDLMRCITARANEIYSGYVTEGLKAQIAFKGVGLSYIKFAMEEPNLFRLLFMSSENVYGIDNVLKEIEINYADIFKCVQDTYGLNEDDGKRLYLQMWIYTHGIAVLCVTGTCAFSADEISGMLTEVCTALIKQLKN